MVLVIIIQSVSIVAIYLKAYSDGEKYGYNKGQFNGEAELCLNVLESIEYEKKNKGTDQQITDSLKTNMHIRFGVVMNFIEEGRDKSWLEERYKKIEPLKHKTTSCLDNANKEKE